MISVLFYDENDNIRTGFKVAPNTFIGFSNDDAAILDIGIAEDINCRIIKEEFVKVEVCKSHIGVNRTFNLKTQLNDFIIDLLT